MGRATVEADEFLVPATERLLQVLIESTKHLPAAFKDAGNELDWTGMVAFRNLLVHDYLGLDWGIVWQIVDNDLPELSRWLDQLMQEASRISDDSAPMDP